jgi:hypothetical protein
MIKVVTPGSNGGGVIKNAISSNRREEINAENILDFEAILDQKLNSLVNENSIFELDGDWFDTAVYENEVNEDGTYSIKIEADHVSYRLNKPEYNLDFFTEEGTPEYIFGKMLEGTGFTVKTVEFTDLTAFSAQEKKSRRQLVMEFAAYLGGELIFEKFEISLVRHRGTATVRPVVMDRDVTLVSRSVNKREKDENGNPTVSYKCRPIVLPGRVYALGDDVRLIQPKIGVNQDLRIVSIERDPYDVSKVTLEFAKYTNGLAASLYRIETSSVVKDKVYNGTRIGPEYGFENIRSDKRARSYYRADEMKFQSGDGSGSNWTDRLYFETDPETGETSLVLNGRLSVSASEKVFADVDPSTVQDKVGKIGGTNFLRNSSFWFLKAAWDFLSDNANVPVIDETIGRTDKVCAKITGENGIAKCIQQVITGYWAEKILVSSYIRTLDVVLSTEACTAMAVIAIDSNDETHGYLASNLEGTLDWTRQILVVDPKTWGDGLYCKEIQVYVYGRNFTGSLYADDLMVQEGDAVTSWAPSPKELKTSSMEVSDERIYMRTQQFLLELMNVLGDVVFAINANGDSIMRWGIPGKTPYIDIGLDAFGQPNFTMYTTSGELQHGIRPDGDVHGNGVMQQTCQFGDRVGIGWFIGPTT